MPLNNKSGWFEDQMILLLIHIYIYQTIYDKHTNC